MQIEPYPQFGPLDIVKSQLIGVFGPRRLEESADPDGIIRDGFASPLGSRPLRDVARGARRVLILADDLTRVTPVRAIMPYLIEELAVAEIRANQIEVLIALGTHRAMTKAEIQERFGPGVVDSILIENHRPLDPSALVDLGPTDRGTPIQVNRKLLEVDLVVGLGHIVPHCLAGFSGGAKIVQPGVCGVQTTAGTHWRAATLIASGHRLLGEVENDIRTEMNQVARRAGLRFIVNAVQDGSNRLVRLVTGDPEVAHRTGAALSRTIFGVEVPEPADIVVAQAYPADYDLWQASKALDAARAVVKRGGTIVLLAPCPGGVSREHPIMLERGREPFADVARLVAAGQIADVVGAGVISILSATREHCNVILVASGIRPEEARRLGWHWAAIADEGLSLAMRQQGADCRVLVLENAGEVLPLVGRP